MPTLGAERLQKLEVTGRSATGRDRQLWLSTCRSNWRNSPHHEGSIVARVEDVVVGTEVVVENSASRRNNLDPDL